MKTLTLAAAALLVLSGCSSTSTSTGLTAEQVTTKLVEKIPSAKHTKTFNAEDDPNHQLGRPNGYTGKTAFSDSRVPADQLPADEFATERGGGVEVFPDAAGAQARKDRIQEIAKSMGGLINEYDYVRGPILVRVSHLLTPEQAKEYETALATIS